MGDMADFALEELSDLQYGPNGPYDGFDNVMYDDSTETYRGPKTGSHLTCRNCGESGFVWGQYPSGKWWLFKDNKPHRCV